MIDIAELKKLIKEDDLGMDQVLLPISEFIDFLFEIKKFRDDEEAQKFLLDYLLENKDALREEFEKKESVNAVEFADIAIIPLRKLCCEIDYPKKDIFLQRYKYLIASIQNYNAD